MCLAWIKFQQNTGSNCFASWRRFQLFQEWIQRELERWPFARTRECVDGEKEIEGNILEGGELRRMGCCW